MITGGILTMRSWMSMTADYQANQYYNVVSVYAPGWKINFQISAGEWNIIEIYNISIFAGGWKENSNTIQIFSAHTSVLKFNSAYMPPVAFLTTGQAPHLSTPQIMDAMIKYRQRVFNFRNCYC